MPELARILNWVRGLLYNFSWPGDPVSQADASEATFVTDLNGRSQPTQSTLESEHYKGCARYFRRIASWPAR